MANCSPGRSMGIYPGLEGAPKRKFRWLFSINGVCGDQDIASVDALPPRKSALPQLGWKEESFQHLTETIWYPLKPEWKPVNLTLFDVRCNKNPVFDWITQSESSGPGFYDVQSGTITPIVDAQLKRTARIELFDGCGQVIDSWLMENCYPSSVEFGELDMDSSDLITVEISLRYDRAYNTHR